MFVREVVINLELKVFLVVVLRMYLCWRWEVRRFGRELKVWGIGIVVRVELFSSCKGFRGGRTYRIWLLELSR